MRKGFDFAGFEDGGKEQPLQGRKDQGVNPPLEPLEVNIACSHVGFSLERPGSNFHPTWL